MYVAVWAPLLAAACAPMPAENLNALQANSNPPASFADALKVKSDKLCGRYIDAFREVEVEIIRPKYKSEPAFESVARIVFVPGSRKNKYKSIIYGLVRARDTSLPKAMTLGQHIEFEVLSEAQDAAKIVRGIATGRVQVAQNTIWNTVQKKRAAGIGHYTAEYARDHMRRYHAACIVPALQGLKASAEQERRDLTFKNLNNYIRGNTPPDLNVRLERVFAEQSNNARWHKIMRALLRKFHSLPSNP